MTSIELFLNCSIVLLNHTFARKQHSSLSPFCLLFANFTPSKEPSVCKLHANNGSSSTDYAADLNDLPTTCIAWAFPKRVHVTVVQKSKPTPTSCSSDAFGNHRVTSLKKTLPSCKTICKTANFDLSCFFPCFSWFKGIYS